MGCFIITYGKGAAIKKKLFFDLHKTFPKIRVHMLSLNLRQRFEVKIFIVYQLLPALFFDLIILLGKVDIVLLRDMHVEAAGAKSCYNNHT
jgi:hypothetical protein